MFLERVAYVVERNAIFSSNKIDHNYNYLLWIFLWNFNSARIISRFLDMVNLGLVLIKIVPHLGIILPVGVRLLRKIYLNSKPI